MKVTTLALAAAATTLLSLDAHAAAQAPCAPATIAPTAKTIPINFPGFGYTALKATENNLQLVEQGSSTLLPLKIGAVEGGLLKVTPKDPLVVGKTYALQFDAFCSFGAYPEAGPFTFTVGPAAPLPTKLGTVDGTPAVVVKDYGTSKLSITARFALDAEMKPWANVHRLGLTVDGKVIETKATVAADGSAVDVVATGWCDDALAAKPKHDIVLRARLPFAPTLDTTAAALQFACPAPAIKTATGNPPVAPSPEPSASGSAPRPTTGASSGSDGGCSITLANTAADAGLTLPALAALAIATRRRRSQESRKSHQGGN